MEWCRHLVPVPRQADFCESEASLVYITGLGLHGLYRKLLSQNKNKETNNKKMTKKIAPVKEWEKDYFKQKLSTICTKEDVWDRTEGTSKHAVWMREALQEMPEK